MQLKLNNFGKVLKNLFFNMACQGSSLEEAWFKSLVQVQDVVGCATVVACVPAIGGASLLVVNGLDDIRTGWNNFGALPEGQTASSTLTSLGVPEANAEWVKLGAGFASIGAEVAIIYKRLTNGTKSLEKLMVL